MTSTSARIELHADRTFVGEDATILADAGQDGDGGKVLVLADDAAQMYGTISARGGANSGNGGFVEVSGKERLDFRGTADLRRQQWRVGTLLLDPTDITISGAASTPTSTFGGGTFSNPTTTPSNLNVTTLTNQLGLEQRDRIDGLGPGRCRRHHRQQCDQLHLCQQPDTECEPLDHAGRAAAAESTTAAPAP